jgi:hypothetical protein
LGARGRTQAHSDREERKATHGVKEGTPGIAARQ